MTLLDVFRFIAISLPSLGAFSFGAMLGWVTYRTLRRQEEKASWKDIAAILTNVAGAGVTALFPDKAVFGAYGVGLGVGFFMYLITAMSREKRWKTEAAESLKKGGKVPLHAPATLNVDRWMGEWDAQQGQPTRPPVEPGSGSAPGGNIGPTRPPRN